jgi:hypothetical protein
MVLGCQRSSGTGNKKLAADEELELDELELKPDELELDPLEPGLEKSTELLELRLDEPGFELETFTESLEPWLELKLEGLVFGGGSPPPPHADNPNKKAKRNNTVGRCISVFSII